MRLFSTAGAFVRLAGALALEALAPSGCAACDAPVRLRTAFCASCAATLAPASGAPCLAAVAYGGAVARAIARFKYEGRPDLARPLAALLARAVEPARGGFDVACPVPLHAARLAERGFNQSALLGAKVARALGVPWDARLLARTRDTPRQAALDRAARGKNVEGAFRVRDARRVRGARVLVVDDVCTTGATLRACAATLEGAGARAAAGAVVAWAEG